MARSLKVAFLRDAELAALTHAARTRGLTEEQLTAQIVRHYLDAQASVENPGPASTPELAEDARYREVFCAMEQGILVLDRRGRLVDWNPAAERLLGYDAATLARGDLTLLQRMRMPDADPRSAPLTRALREGRSSQNQIIAIRRPDGSRVWFAVSAEPLFDGGDVPRGAVAWFFDTTPRVELEEALRLSEERYRAFFEQSPTAIAMLTPDGTTLQSNPALEKLWGIRHEQLIGFNFLEGAPVIGPVLRDALVRAQRGEPTFSPPLYMIPGQYGLPLPPFWMRLSVYPVFGQNHQLREIVMVQEDVTQMKRAESDAAARAAELSQAKLLDELKEHFISAISHELRTPLTAITSYAEFLEDGIGGPLSAMQAEFVQQIQDGGKRLARLVDDLLDFTELEAGRFRLLVREGDFSETVDDVLDVYRAQMAAAHLTIAVEAERPLTLRMDPQRVAQILDCLLSNAIKFTPDGGRITIRTTRAGELVRCEVTDTGVGIAKEDQPKLFQRFSQLPTKQARTVSGAGIGLFMAKVLVEAHGGTIGVESVPGQGSTFWFTLPAQGPDPHGFPIECIDLDLPEPFA